MKRTALGWPPFSCLRPSSADTVHRPAPRLFWHDLERVWATIGSLLIHVGLVLFLLNFDGRASAQLNAVAGESRMLLVFEDITFVPKLPSSPTPTSLPSGMSAETITSPGGVARQSVERPVSARDSAVELDLDEMPEAEGNTEIVGRTALDLSLPEGQVAPQAGAFPERKPWERRQALEVETTRFAGDWAPDDDAAADLAWRSKTAAFIMSVFGGGAKTCTSEERRQRHPRCVPDHARQEDIQ